MRIRWIVMVLVLVLEAPVNTQRNISAIMIESGELATLREARFDGLAKGGKCGPYFAHSGDGKGVLRFILRTNTSEGIKPLSAAVEKTFVRVIIGIKVPTVIVIPIEGLAATPWMGITISPEDYAKSPCLAQASSTLYKV